MSAPLTITKTGTHHRHALLIRFDAHQAAGCQPVPDSRVAVPIAWMVTTARIAHRRRRSSHSSPELERVRSEAPERDGAAEAVSAANVGRSSVWVGIGFNGAHYRCPL